MLNCEATRQRRYLKNFNTAELSRVDVLSSSKSMWNTVWQFTGRNKTNGDENQHCAITTCMSWTLITWPYQQIPSIPEWRIMANTQYAFEYVTESRIGILDTLRPAGWPAGWDCDLTGWHTVMAPQCRSTILNQNINRYYEPFYILLLFLSNRMQLHYHQFQISQTHYNHPTIG